MSGRGSLARILLAVLAPLAVAALVASGALSPGAARGATTTTLGDNARTLTVSLPGPFTGCTYLDRGASATSNAVLDLVRPSAFLNNPNGNLTGEGGPIATAELTSLQPETVVYTIAPHQAWSDGSAFTGADLVAWWQRARALASVVSDGYRSITTLSLSKDALSVTAVFSTPYADWNQLFRDVEARDAPLGCALADLVRRPSLGPYRVTSATASRIVLVLDPRWKADPGRFGRVVLTTDGALPTSAATPFANYFEVVTRAEVQALSAHPAVQSHLGTSSLVEEITFAPSRPATRALVMREALSWALDRQAVINQLWGAITFSPAVAASAIFSQGQNAYPGGGGTTPTTQPQSTSTTVAAHPSGLADCAACAVTALTSAGYHRTKAGWVSGAGAPLTVRVATGPRAVDAATTALLVRQWAAAGVAATVARFSSDAVAAEAAAANHTDVAVFAKPTTASTSFAARAFAGPAYADAYPSGFRSAATAKLFTQALANFNPAAAVATWLQFDQAIMRAFWVRPLYTAPSLVEWSPKLSGVSGSISIPGFVDQLTNWSTAPPFSGS